MPQNFRCVGILRNHQKPLLKEKMIKIVIACVELGMCFSDEK